MNPWPWIVHFMGVDFGVPYGHWVWYNFHSGFGSDLGEYALLGGVITLVRKHNCEVHRCWRLGRHDTAAGHSVCRRHHPDDHLTEEDVRRHHHRALENAKAGK